MGQLGQGEKQISLEPFPVSDLIQMHVIIRHICAGIFHNAVISVDNEVYTWGSNVHGCLGRASELDGLEEEFCVVPGRVEGMERFVGPACSIACGREYTLIATRPYIGPKPKELETIEAENAKKEEIIRKQEERELEEYEEFKRLIIKQKREKLIQVLNEAHPKCSRCSTDTLCPGYKEVPRHPRICQYCQHEKRQHTRLLKETDLHNTLEYLMKNLELLNITVDLSKFDERLEMYNAPDDL